MSDENENQGLNLSDQDEGISSDGVDDSEIDSDMEIDLDIEDEVALAIEENEAERPNGNEGDFLEWLSDDNPFELLYDSEEDDENRYVLPPLDTIAEESNAPVPLRPPPTVREKILSTVKKILVKAKDLRAPSDKLDKMSRDGWAQYITEIRENLGLCKSDKPSSTFFPDPFTSSDHQEQDACRSESDQPDLAKDNPDFPSNEPCGSVIENQDPTDLAETIQGLLEKFLSDEAPFPAVSDILDSATDHILESNLAIFNSIQSDFQVLDEMIKTKAESDCLTYEEKEEIRGLRNNLEDLYKLNTSIKNYIRLINA